MGSREKAAWVLFGLSVLFCVVLTVALSHAREEAKNPLLVKSKIERVVTNKDKTGIAIRLKSGHILFAKPRNPTEWMAGHEIEVRRNRINYSERKEIQYELKNTTVSSYAEAEILDNVNLESKDN